MSSASFDGRLDAALSNAEIYFKRYSGFTIMNADYKVLFKHLWRRFDNNESGMISLENCERFATEMVSNGWTDWKVSDRERQNWNACASKDGFISVEHFAEISENEGFVPPPSSSSSNTVRAPAASTQLLDIAIQNKKAKIEELESQLRREKIELADLEKRKSNSSDGPTSSLNNDDGLDDDALMELDGLAGVDEGEDDGVPPGIAPAGGHLPTELMFGFGGGKRLKKNIPSGDDRPHMMLELIDGANNRYGVWVMPVKADPWIICAAYDPITPIESCSGTYSGGDPIFHKGRVTREMYEELEEIIVNKIESKTDLAPSRHKGTGILKAPNQESAVLTSSGYAPIATAFRKLLNLK